VGCSTEEVSNDISSKVSFLNQTHTVTETMESISIPLKLDLKAINDGYVTVELSGNAAYGTDFTTVPEAVNNKVYINLLTNEQETSFVVTRANTLIVEKTISLKLSNPTAGFSLGNSDTSEVKLNALPYQVNQLNFEATTGTVSEGDSDGLVININASNAVPNGTRARVKVTIPEGITYGTHFYTIPAATENEIEVEFNQNAQSTSFKLIPVDDNLVMEDYTVLFELTYVTDGLEIGDQKEFTADILENDQTTGVINTIAELKNKFSEHQEGWYLPEDYFIEGVITSNGNTLDNKSVYIQDATSGILIHFTTANIFNQGDKIRLNLKNATGASFNDQKTIDGVSINGYAKYAENIPVTAETITFEQLHSGNYEGKRVRIENVQFVEANGTVKFLGNHTIRKDDSGATVTVYPAAQFSDAILPTGTITVSGIVGDYGRILPQKFTHDITID